MLEEEKDSVVGGLKIITEGILRAVLKEEIYPMRAQVSGSLEIITTPLPFLFYFYFLDSSVERGNIFSGRTSVGKFENSSQ